MIVRLALESDAARIMEIERAAHFHPWSETVLRRYLNRPDTVRVLEVNNQVVGYSVNTLIAGEAELLMIAVDPKQQGKGYGRALMDEMLNILQNQNAEQWFLDVRESNEKAIGLYESMGFCQAGVRSNYYPTATGDEDALLYCLDLRF